MSVRIHQLSKDLGMENKELIELLKSRGYEVKSASSTIDNISAEALREEFAAQAPQPAEPEPEAPVAPKLPEGAFVKSAADIDREHQKKAVAEEAEKAAKAPKQVSPRHRSWRPLPHLRFRQKRLIRYPQSLRQLPHRRLLDRPSRPQPPKPLMKSKHPLPNLLKVRALRHLWLKPAS